MPFLFYHQSDFMDCGPTYLQMVAKFYGRTISLPKLHTLSETIRKGSSLKNVADTAEKIGFCSLGVKITFQKFVQEALYPALFIGSKNIFFSSL